MQYGPRLSINQRTGNFSRDRQDGQKENHEEIKGLNRKLDEQTDANRKLIAVMLAYSNAIPTAFSILADELVHVPNREAVHKFSQEIGGRMFRYGNVRLEAKIAMANEQPYYERNKNGVAVELNVPNGLHRMTYNEKRELCQKVFGGKTVEGKRMGIWMSWSDDGKKWKHQIEGHLVYELNSDKRNEFVYGNVNRIRDAVTNSANY